MVSQTKNIVMKKIFPLILLVALIATLALLLRNDTPDASAPTTLLAPEGEPIDVVNEFYSNWLSARKSTSTDTKLDAVVADGPISIELKERILAAQAATQDPVLCQTAVPERTGARIISQTDTSAEAQVLSRGLPERSSLYARVTLAAVNGQWQIVAITCEDAATEPTAGEFTFVKEGYLLKSVPPPLNSDYWHIVFTENDVSGHTAPLFFSETSLCVETDGSEAVCEPNQFIEPARVQVEGTMTEAGVEVARITFQ